MTEIADLNCFIEDSRALSSEAELGELMGALVREMGFDHYSLFRKSADGAPPIVLTDYPQAWVERIVERRYHTVDPVYVAARRTAVGFRRSEITTHLRMNDRQEAILAEAQRAGLSDWYAVPAHVSGEAVGLATFTVGAGRVLPDRSLPAAQLAGAFGYEAARRLRRSGLAVPAGPVQLTERQIDCLLLIARGKTDWEIGRILGLEEDTVGKYVSAARRRYGVARRSQLVVRALYDGHFSLAEAVH